MTDVNTVVDTDTNQPATEPASTDKGDANLPRVEVRDGRYYVDGARVYTRDDTNKIAATARQEAERNLLSTLEVDNIESVKEVIRQLRTTGPEGDNALNISSLKDAVKKKEQTVDELQNRINSLQRELVLNRNMTHLYSAMPAQWSADQKQAVIDLMNARGMIQVEGETFAIRNGDSFLTEDGEKPDYKAAVELVGKTLGLGFGKQGVAVTASDRQPTTGPKSDVINEEMLRSDPKYRSAYALIRSHQPHLSRTQITDSMIRAKMAERLQAVANLSQVGLVNTGVGQTNSRRK